MTTHHIYKTIFVLSILFIVQSCSTISIQKRNSTLFCLIGNPELIPVIDNKYLDFENSRFSELRYGDSIISHGIIYNSFNQQDCEDCFSHYVVHIDNKLFAIQKVYLGNLEQYIEREKSFNNYNVKGSQSIDKIDEKNIKSKDYHHQNSNTRNVQTSSPKAIQTGERGGQYYINSNGKKTYIKKK
jgi:hypothetical protein